MYQGLNILFQDNVSASTTTDYFFANGIQISDKVSSGNPIYFLVDNLGSTRVTTSNAGDVQFSSDYIPFGIPYGQSGSPVPQQQYTGKMRDSQVSAYIYYFDARYYDSSTGRFVTQDKSNFRLSDPLSLNRYIYARDNPLTYIDPTGNVAVIGTGHYWYPIPKYPSGSSPPPNTNHNPVTSPKTSTSTSSSQISCAGQTYPCSTSYVTYFTTVWAPAYEVQLAFGLALVIAVFLGPAAVVLLGQGYIFGAALVLVLGQIGYDLGNIVGDLQSGNTAHALFDLGQLALDATTSILQSLGEGTLIELALLEGLWTFGTVGVGSLVDFSGGFVAAGVFGITTFFESAYDWANTVPPDGQ